MNTQDPSPPSIVANWQPFECRPTWSGVTTVELAKALGISVPLVHSWILRGKLPQAEVKSKIKGNRNVYQIAKVRSLLENRPEEIIHWEWIRKMLPTHEFQTLGQAVFLVKNCYELLGVEKPIC